MKIRFLFFLTAFCFCSSFVLAQNQRNLDSLQHCLSKAKEDTGKIKIYISLLSAHQYYLPKEGLKYEKPATVLAIKLNKKKYLPDIKHRAGRLYWRMGDFKKALIIHNESLKYAYHFKEYFAVQRIYIAIAQDYADQSLYPQTIANFYKSLAQAKKNKDDVAIALVCRFLFWTYCRIGDYPQAIKNQYEALKIYEKTKNPILLAKCLAELAEHYDDLNNEAEAVALRRRAIPLLEKSDDPVNTFSVNMYMGRDYLYVKDYSQAKKHLNIALQLALNQKDHGFIADAYEVLGKLNKVQGNKEDALKNYLLSAENFLAMNYEESYAGLCFTVAESYIALHLNEKAEEYINKAFTINKKIKSPMLETEYYGIKAKLDSATGHWQSAYSNSKIYIRRFNKINNDEVLSKISLTANQYAYDIKDAIANAELRRKETLIKEEIEKQKQIRNWIIGGLCIVALLLFFVFRNYYKQSIAGKKLIKTRRKILRSEKMAAFGNIAADVVNEIQQPLSSLNHYSQKTEALFSEVHNAKTRDAKHETILYLRQNLDLIKQYGMQAEAIVKQLQQNTKTITEN